MLSLEKHISTQAKEVGEDSLATLAGEGVSFSIIIIMEYSAPSFRE